MHVLIDSDIIAFKACCVTEYPLYKSPSLGTFRLKGDLKKLLEFNFEEDEIERALAELEKDVQREPISQTYKVVDSLIERIVRNTDADRYTLVVKGDKPNFRKDIDYPVVYKGNRPEKPTNYDACMGYIRGMANTARAEGIEVDDLLGILQDKEYDTTCIASSDKDLLQIPGLHYHLDKEKLFKVTEEAGNRWFWMQMLIGDRVDNIQGVDGIGPVKAEKLISPEITWEEMELIVQAEYKKCFKEDWFKMFDANRRLLWILREMPSGT